MPLKLPNVLTILRIVSIPFLIGALACQTGAGNVLALALYVLSCVTDYLDGALARRWRQFSELGRMMDPIADKLLVGALLLALAGFGHLKFFSLYAAIIIMLREIMVSGLREYMAFNSHKIPSTRLAKWKTAIQMLAIGFLVIGDSGCVVLGLDRIPAYDIGSILLWLSVVPTLMSGWGYLKAGFSSMK